ncbi:MAG: hypothetical protein ABDH19_03765 [Thermodesulfovibrio sp.]
MKSFKMIKLLVQLIIITINFILLSNNLYAHKVNAYAYREGDKVFGECYFVDGSPCKKSKVEVYDLQGKKILETFTDEKGKFSFITEQKKAIKVVVSAGQGHKAVYKVEGAKEEVEKATKKKQTQIDREELKKIIDETMDTKLQGLKNEIMDLRKEMEKVKLREIIGGIGYIIGIWGIIMLIKRKKNAS